MIPLNSNGEMPALARIFRLERNGQGCDKTYCKANDSNMNRMSKDEIDPDNGFDYRSATAFLRNHPEEVQYVTYDGNSTEMPCSFDFDKGSTQNNQGYTFPALSNNSTGSTSIDSTITSSNISVMNSAVYLHSPLGWACIETVQEEEAMEFLSTIRDIDPTVFLLQDSRGALPIGGECTLNASIPMLRFLLDIFLNHDFWCPNGPKMTEDNFNPLTCLCGSCWWEDIQQSYHEIVSGERIVKGANVLEDNLGIDDNFWARILLLVKAFYHKTIDDIKDETVSNANDTNQFLYISNEYGQRTIKFRLLHACAGIDWFPPNLLRLLVAAFPAALMERDEDGNLPIHVAASGIFNSFKIDATWDGDFEANSGYQKTTIDILLEASPESASILNGERKLPLELALESEHPTGDSYGKPWGRPWEDGGIGSLLKAYPEAAKIRSLATGKLPLEIALENHREWDDGINTLLEANPEAARSCNPFNGKLPLELAIEKEIHFDEGVYRLLELSPVIVTQEHSLGSKTNKSTKRKTMAKNALPLFAQAAARDCSVSVIYKLLRMWPHSCKVERYSARLNCNKKPLETTSEPYITTRLGKRQKRL